VHLGDAANLGEPLRGAGSHLVAEFDRDHSEPARLRPV
jgi:hypothetical protein